MSIRFIVNLRSGHAARHLARVQAFATARGATVVLTERPRHACELARQALGDGCDLIVAVGGDGTMNEVASALIGTGATLGLVPCGSGDGLGRHLHIHGPIPRTLAILESGQPRTIDTGVADGHPFFTVAGLGFEAEIAQRFNQLQRRGFFRYLTTSARALREWTPLDCTIAAGGARQRVRAFTVAIANSDQYGNDALIAPGARVDDALLNLTALPPVTFGNALPLIVRLFHGTIPNARAVISMRGDRFIVERPSPGIIHTDGEIHPAGATVEFAVRPASLRVMAPAPDP